jgi:hypothetical protein
MAGRLQRSSLVLLRRALLLLAVAGWVGACDLNPQPDVPSGSGVVPGKGDAGAGATTGAGGGAIFTPGAGGALPGSGGAGAGPDAGTIPDAASDARDSGAPEAGAEDSGRDGGQEARPDAGGPIDAAGD